MLKNGAYFLRISFNVTKNSADLGQMWHRSAKEEPIKMVAPKFESANRKIENGAPQKD